MNRTLAIILGLLVGAGLVWWLINSQAEESTTTQTQNQTQQTATQTPHAATGEVLSGETTVQIQDFAFAPSIIKVKKGTKVTWINQDSAEHNVVSDSGSTGKGLNGPLLAKGESYSFIFETPGVYSYHCAPHPNMQASVEVID